MVRLAAVRLQVVLSLTPALSFAGKYLTYRTPDSSIPDCRMTLHFPIYIH